MVPVRATGPGSPGGESASAAHSLRLAGLRKTYGGVVAVDGVSLEVPRGEFLTLLGPSGSGQDDAPDDGRGLRRADLGRDPRRTAARSPHLAPERRNFGMVFQGYALFPHMSVAENIAYPLEVRGARPRHDRGEGRGRAGAGRLGGYADRRPRELSGGQQQRVAIARALVFAPDVLLLDEPLGALDRKLRAEVQLELKALHARLGTTFIYVTHDQEEALAMSDRVAIMDRGRRRPDRHAAASSTSGRGRDSSPTSWARATSSPVGRRAARARLSPMPAAAGASCTPGPAPAGGDVASALRPERLRPPASRAAGGAEPRSRPASTEWRYLGPTVSVVTATRASSAAWPSPLAA